MKKTPIFVVIAYIVASACAFSLNTSASSKAGASTSSDNYELPDIEVVDSEEETTASKAVNKLLNASEILISDATMKIYFDNTDESNVLTFYISSLDLDLSGINSLSLNLSMTFNVEYKNSSKLSDIKVILQSNQHMYVLYRNQAFQFAVPQNLADVLNLLQALGLDISSSDSASSVSLSSILSSLKDATDSVTTSGTGSLVKVLIPDIALGDTTLSGLTFDMQTDSEATPTSIGTADKILITTTSEESENSSNSTTASTTGISFQGTITNLSDTSSFNKADSDLYQNVTDANSSLIGTLTHIFEGSYTSNTDTDGNKKKQFGVSLSASLTKSDTTTTDGTTTTTSKTSYVEGTLDSDISDVFVDEDYGTYKLSLVHADTEEHATADSDSYYNKVSAYYSKGNTYLDLNTNFKGKISNDSITNLMSDISDITKDGLYQEVSDDLNVTLKVASSTSLDDLQNGSLDALETIISSYSYTPTEMTLVLAKDALGLEGDITITVNFYENESSKDIKSVVVTGLKVGSVTVDKITLSLKDYTDIEAPTGTYVDYGQTVSLFDNLALFADKKKASATYALDYTDANMNHIAADGKIGFDLSDEDLLVDNGDGTKTLKAGDGDYFLSFNVPANAGESEAGDDNKKDVPLVGQGVDLYYDGSMLYFGYGYTGAYVDGTYTTDLSSYNSYFSDHDKYVFRNSIADATMQDMITVLDDKSTDDSTKSGIASSSLGAMGEFVDTLTSSTKYKAILDGIDNLSFQELDSVLSFSMDESDTLSITLDPSEMLAGTAYADNTSALTLSIGPDGSDITVAATTKIDGTSLSFTLTMTDFESGNFDVSAFNTTDYPTLSDTNLMLKSFLALPTDLEDFDIKATGSVYGPDPDDSTKTEMKAELLDNSGASVHIHDQDNPSDQDWASGQILLNHKSLVGNSSLQDVDGNALNYQKIEFDYESDSTYFTNEKNSSGYSEVVFDNVTSDTENAIQDGIFLVEYNDNMHVNMKKSDLFEITDTIASVPEENLLNRYLKFFNDASLSTGSAIMDILVGKSIATSGLFSSPYILDGTLEAGHVSITFDPRLISSDLGENTNLKLDLYYTGTDSDYHITSATVSGSLKTSDDSTYTISATVSLDAGTDYSLKRDTSDSSASNYVMPYDDTTKSNFIDVAGFKTLLDCLIDTTEKNFFCIQGTLDVAMTFTFIKDWDLGNIITYCYAAIYVEDETAYCYLHFKTNSDSISSTDYRGVEFFIKEQEVICNTTTSSRSERSEGALWRKTTNYTWSSSSTFYKTTAENLEANIAYYILDYIMNLSSLSITGDTLVLGGDTVGEKVLNEIYSSTSSSSSSSSTTISDDFSQVISSAAYADSAFTMNLNLNKFIKINQCDFSDTSVVITHGDDNGSKPLKSIAISTKLNAISIVHVTLSTSDGNNIFTLTQNNYSDLSTAEKNEMARFKTFWENYMTNYASKGDTLISEVTSASSPTYNPDNRTTWTVTGKESESSDYNINYSDYWYLGAF